MTALSKPMMGRNTAKHLREEIGEYIRDLRLGQDMTQVELAEAIGLENKQDISNFETGTRNVPPERVLALAEALNVDPREFGQRILKNTNPFLYAILFDTTEAHAKLLKETTNTMTGRRQGPRKR